MTGRQNINRAEVLAISGKVIQFMLMGVVSVIAWQGRIVLNEIKDHDRRIITIEASRYTPRDALQDRRDWQEMNKQTRDQMREELAAIRKEILDSQATISAKIDRISEYQRGHNNN